MIIINKKKNNKGLYFLIILSIIISFVAGVLAHDAKVAYHFKNVLLKNKHVSKNFLSSYFYNEIASINIDIPFKTLSYLKENIAIATKYNELSLTENEYKRAKITYEKNVYDVGVRLKGQTNAHRIENKK